MSDERTEEAAAIAAIGVHKTYVGGDGSLLEVLAGADLVVQPGETVAIIGESGSGKSTLLHLLGGLDRPTAGDVWIGGTRLANLDEDATSRIRNQSIGFVFQFHHLMREFTVLENVMIPTLIARRTVEQARDRSRQLLCDVGLEARLEHKPSQLSGGEQQRVAVARALVNEPLALLADEPSGNLDPSTSDRLHDLLFAVNENYGTAMVLVTHNMHLAERSGRVLEVREGQLVPTTVEPAEYPKRSVG